MDHKINPNTFYTSHNQTKEEDDDGRYLNEDEDGEMQWVENVVTKKLINITTTIEFTTQEEVVQD
jgi:hypothetical protein